MTKESKRLYTYAFLWPAGIIYFVLFLLPTILSLFFSMTRWTLTEWDFIGFDNFITFFTTPSLNIGFRNTLIFGVLTTFLKVSIGFFIAVFLCSSIKSKAYLRSIVFFPILISTIAIGIVFNSMMHPSNGIINLALESIGIAGPDWLGNTKIALLSLALVETWKSVGVCVVIFIAGIMSIPGDYYEAAKIDGGNKFHALRYITIPLSQPAMTSCIILSLIGGLRNFELIWTMTRGGPGFSTDVMASIVYKQYQQGFYGLATAGNVILFVFVAVITFPVYIYLTRKEVEL